MKRDTCNDFKLLQMYSNICNVTQERCVIHYIIYIHYIIHWYNMKVCTKENYIRQHSIFYEYKRNSIAIILL